MKVLHVTSRMDPQCGGVVQAIHTITYALESVNISSEIVCLEEPDASYIKDNSNIHALGLGKTAWNYHPQLIAWLKENMIKYDIVIAHGMWQYHNFALYRVAKLLGWTSNRILIMPHGMLDPYFQKAPDRRLKAIRNWFFWKLIERNIVNSSGGLLFTCELEKKLAATTFRPYHPALTYVVGLAVTAPPPYEERMRLAFLASSGLTPDTEYFLFLSRVHEKKGLDLLLKAYLALQKKGIELPELVIAGPGLDTEYGQTMKELVEGEAGIHFIGMLQGYAKWGAFYGAQAFILPSHQENFGIAVVEALACGIPVLISDKVNIWKEIIEGSAGLVEKDTEEGILKLLNNWLEVSNERRRHMAVRAIHVYREYFALDGVARNMKNVLESVATDT